MYECYEHIVFLIWFNDLFGIPMAVEIFHNNSLWQSELPLIRWKLMQMSNVNKFVIHKYNIWCWSETIKQSAAGDTEGMSCTSVGAQTGREGMAPPKALQSQALFPFHIPWDFWVAELCQKSGWWSESGTVSWVMQVLSPVLLLPHRVRLGFNVSVSKGALHSSEVWVWSWKWLVMRDIPVN